MLKKKSLTINSFNFTSHRTSEILQLPLFMHFKFFFDEEMIESLHFQTNLYCTQKGRAGSITKDELHSFF